MAETTRRRDLIREPQPVRIRLAQTHFQKVQKNQNPDIAALILYGAIVYRHNGTGDLPQSVHGSRSHEPSPLIG